MRRSLQAFGRAVCAARRRAGVPALALALTAAGGAAPGAELAVPAAAHADDEEDEPASPPAFDLDAPGWTRYPHGGAAAVPVGEGPRGALVFEPLDPRPTEAPLVLFLHGWAALSPAEYGAWIHHLVRQGNVVVFPHWQELLTLPGDFQPNLLAGVRAAVEATRAPERVHVDLRRVAVVGHSMGGLLAANYAAVAADEGLPVPRVVLCVQPGRASQGPRDPMPPLEDLARIDPATLLVTLAGDRDAVTGTRDAKAIVRAATRVPAERKAYVFLLSDDHGWPALRADHLMPLGRDERYETSAFARVRGSLSDRRDVDALDVYALWQPFDRLRALGFGGATRLDRTALVELGEWSDGTPVAEPLVLDLVGRAASGAEDE